jgi:hypothetical protein
VKIVELGKLIVLNRDLAKCHFVKPMGDLNQIVPKLPDEGRLYLPSCILAGPWIRA